MRLFFALWPPAEVADRLHAWATAVRSQVGGRAIRPASIHLTLAFLGEQSADRYVLASAVAQRVASILAVESCARVPFALNLDAPDYFRHNRIVWVGPNGAPGTLADLAASLDRALRAAGFDLERRAFSPHVTLLRGAGTPQAWPALPPVSWAVGEFVLVESVREAGAVRYVVRERFLLERI